MKPDYSPSAEAQAYGGVLLRNTGHILLREPTNHFDGYVWTFAKGKPDPGETSETTALREVLEETGYQAEVVDILPGVFHSGLSSNAYYVMRPVGAQGRPQWETQRTRWVDFETAATLIAETINVKGRERDLAVLAAAKTWFVSNQPVLEPDGLGKATQPASRADWRIQEMPAEHASLTLDFILTAKEATRVRLGFIPSVMEEKWFSYFADNTLYQHRSWTGYCVDQIHFETYGDGLRATHAEVNRNPEQYAEGDDEQDIRRIETMVHELGQGAWDDGGPGSFEAAVALAAQPNYLGNPQVVAALFEPYFQLLIASWQGKANYADKLAMNLQITRTMCEDGTGYTRLPGWHNAAGLGRNVIRYLGLDADEHGESLAMLVSEGLASVSLAFNDLRLQWSQVQRTGQEMDLSRRLKTLGWFVVTVFMGTNDVYFPDKVLEDIVYPKRSAHSGNEADGTAASVDEDLEKAPAQPASIAPSSFEALLAELRAIDALQRKPPFKFAQLGIAAGTVLTFKLDPSITCVVAEKNRVVFQDQTISLSRAAVLALQNHGRKVKVARGPDYWLCNGQPLSKINSATTGEKLHGT